MTELFQHEQTKLIEQSPILTRSEMPSFYSPTRHRTFITKHLADHDDDDPNSIYKEALIIQMFQHWKIKTLEHQHATHDHENNPTPNHFSQALATKVPQKEPSDTEIIPNASIETPLNNTDKNIIEDESPTVKEVENPMITLQKRVTPIPASYTRRKAALKKSNSTPTNFINPNLLTPHAKNKSGPGPGTGAGTITAATTARKSIKPGPIFIAPKKTQPAPPPRSVTLFSFDESVQTKRKSILEKQNSVGDDQNMPTTPTWAPAPPTTPIRFYVQSSGSSIDDDRTSSDESDHESLLIRNKKNLKKTSKIKERHNLSIPTNLNIPTAIFITDPQGHSYTFDPNTDYMEERVDIEEIVDNQLHPININSLYPNGIFDFSSSCAVLTPPISPTSLDKYALHSIGEEEEDTIGKDNNNGIILLKELDRIEAYKRSRETNLDIQKNDTNRVEYENNKIPLGRRWSDSVVSDDEEHTRIPQSPLVKTTSTTSVMKQPITPPVKISKTKLLLMKLHLTPSPNKADDSNTSSTSTTNSSSRKRTVRRSSDKKRYQTR